MLPHKTVQLGRGQGIDNKIIIHWLPLVVGCGHDGASVQQDLDDLVVVGVGGQDEWGDVGRERGRVRWQRLPALDNGYFCEIGLSVDCLLCIETNLFKIHSF